MNKYFWYLYVLAILPMFASACSTPAAHAERVVPTAAVYRSILGKSLNDQEVKDWLATNHCVAALQFQLCKDAGIALLVDSKQLVETVHMYLNNVSGFSPYNGELPYGLKFYDTMEAVVYKLKRQGVGKAGLPDSGGTPDHLHYWANYRRAKMTIIYNTPSPEDEDALIYAVLVRR